MTKKAPSTPLELEPLLLQAYFDDELDADERARVRSLLDDEPTQARLDSLEEMRQLVRFNHEQHLEDLSLDGLWDRVESAIELPEPTPQRPPAPNTQRSWGQRLLGMLGLDGSLAWPAFAVAALALIIALPILLNQTPTNPAVLLPTPSPTQTRPPRISIMPPETDEDWLVSAPNSDTPVIWYIGDEPTPPSTSSPEEIERRRQKILRLTERLHLMNRNGFSFVKPDDERDLEMQQDLLKQVIQYLKQMPPPASSADPPATQDPRKGPI